jgi:hypothetical protein
VPSGNPTEAFKAHSNYIRAFAYLVAPRVRLYPATMEAVAVAAKALGTTPAAEPNVSGALKSLSIAWRTELWLDLTTDALPSDYHAKLANTWAVIQVYYVFYHCTQALVQAKGHPRPQSHPKTQKMFYDYWGQRPLVLAPWTFAFDAGGPHNVPSGVAIDNSIHVWNACNEDTCWSLAALALRTTRQDAVEEALRKRRKDAQSERKREWNTAEGKRIEQGLRPLKKPPFPMPQLSDEAKEGVQRQVRPHTVMDYLYRVRIRTNYVDSAMFTDGPEDGASLGVRNNLRRLCGATLLLHEIVLAGLLGGEVMRTRAANFLTITAPAPGGVHVSLRDRVRFLEGLP